ncbi:OmpA family protein [Phycicoccus sp. BSK3Z-2]|uniref:OmpA family protein n=2 Tax=Phycicoccus avicenniae TaxID=2828860 RepID=A0A941HZ70_9MICO|nr:OmpA family protein [Phycicoccus avicenniae]
MGTPQDALGDRATFSAYGNGNTYVFPQGTNTLCAAAAVDAEQGLAYGALAASTPTGCLSTGIVDFATTAEDPERAPVAHVVLAEVPDDVDVVDVFVASQLVQGVPVEDGPLEPTVEEAAPAVGTGWPSVDAAEVAEADDSRSVFDLQSRVKDLSEDVTTTQDGEQQELDLDASVLFATDEARLTSRARSVIADAAEQIEAAGTSGTITVTGHTDSNASDSYNLDLSQRRARAVGRALEQRLPDGITVRTEGKGEAEPIADNGTAEGRALNRRVTITLPS